MPLTETYYTGHVFSNGTRILSIYVYPVIYEDEGDYVISIYHVTRNQNVTVHINVQGKYTENETIYLELSYPSSFLSLFLC